MIARFGLIAVVLAALLTGCAGQSLKDQRAARAADATAGTPVRIGFVWPFSDEADRLPDGVAMAVQEINTEKLICDPLPGEPETTPPAEATAGVEATAETTPPVTAPGSNCRIQPGGVLGGRRLELVPRDDAASQRESRLIAQEFADDTSIVAVIGHAYSSRTIAAAPLYEFNGLVMLSPAATSPDLTRNNFHYIFRNVQSDADNGRQLALYASESGYTRLLILYYADSYGRQLSNVFENEAGRLGMTIVDRRSYETPRNFPSILADWENETFDAIMIAGYNPDAAVFVRDARRRGLRQPIIGSDGMDTGALWDIARESSLDMVVGSFFAPDSPERAVQTFVIRFQNEYDALPDTWAALGYDAVHLLADAINRAGSTVPADIAAALHATRDWPGVTGIHNFNAAGDVVAKPLVLKTQRPTGLSFMRLATVAEQVDP